MTAVTATPTVRRPDYRHAAGSAQRGLALASLTKSETDLERLADLSGEARDRYDRLRDNCRKWALLCREIQEDAEFLAGHNSTSAADPSPLLSNEPPAVQLEADEVAVLKWLADHPRPVHDCPAGMQFSLAAVCRRRLLKLGLVSSMPGHPDYVYQLTDAGTAYLKANDLLATPPLAFTTHPIRVVVSDGRQPVYYLIGTPTPPFDGLSDAGPVLGVVSQRNPNAAGDAVLWAHAWATRQALADLLDAVTKGRGVRPHDVELNLAVHRAADVLERTAG